MGRGTASRAGNLDTGAGSGVAQGAALDKEVAKALWPLVAQEALTAAEFILMEDDAFGKTRVKTEAEPMKSRQRRYARNKHIMKTVRKVYRIFGQYTRFDRAQHLGLRPAGAESSVLKDLPAMSLLGLPGAMSRRVLEEADSGQLEKWAKLQSRMIRGDRAHWTKRFGDREWPEIFAEMMMVGQAAGRFDMDLAEMSAAVFGKPISGERAANLFLTPFLGGPGRLSSYEIWVAPWVVKAIVEDRWTDVWLLLATEKTVRPELKAFLLSARPTREDLRGNR